MKSRHKVYLMSRHLLGRDYLAICLFGFVFAKRPLNAVELNHELIHAAQQKELLYIPFFIWYGAEWLLLLFKYRNCYQAYLHVRFEREAYRHQADLHYLESRKHYHYSG